MGQTLFDKQQPTKASRSC